MAGTPVGFKRYPWRWVNLALYGFGNLTNGALWICFSSIQVHASEFLDTSKSGINMLSMVFMILYVPGTLFASYIT